MLRGPTASTLLTATLILIGSSPARADVIYVRAGVGLGGDGQSWGTAYRFLQDALFAAQAGDEIWVAAGTYRPDRSDDGHVSIGDREASFSLVAGVAMYGGLAGTEDPLLFDMANRDLTANETTLSGDLGINDGAGFANNGENSIHLVYSEGVTTTAVLDGFTITAGNADGDQSFWRHFGAGMYNRNSSPTIQHCRFTANWGLHGAAMVNFSSPVTVIGCEFSGNVTADTGTGGGIYTHNSSPKIIDCVFVSNSAGSGGGMFNYTNASPTVINCGFVDNHVTWFGGGICNEQGRATMTNCGFVGNTARYGGAVYNSGAQASTLINCTVFGNHADDYGGGICNYAPSVLTNSIVWGNTAGLSASQIYYDFYVPAVTHCNVEAGWDGDGNISDNPMFTDPSIFSFTLQAGSPCIDAGNSDAVPADDLDLDGDGDVVEPIPLDLAGGQRFMNDPDTPDTGFSSTPGLAIVDMGAFELQVDPPNPDLDGDEDIDVADYAILESCLAGPGVTVPPPGADPLDFDNSDLDLDGDVDLGDFANLQRAFTGSH